MAHHTVRSGYQHLVERLNRFPQGAPPSELLYKILALLFSEREADLVSRLPIRPFTVAKAARAWTLPEAEAQAILESLADRALLLDIEQEGHPLYVLPPPMAGFFEFSLMRVRMDIDQQALARLFYEYMNVEEDFIKALFAEGDTPLGRVFVRESVLPPQPALQVLDHERASWVVTSASDIGVGMCYCRHKMQHLDRACKAPMNICMTFNSTAASLIRHGFARRIEAAECLDLLEEARALRLVQFGENVQRRVNFICNCCGCCCEAMLAARRFGFLHGVQTTNFLPEVDREKCTGCGRCVAACPVEALSLVSAHRAAQPHRKAARLDPSACLGCGVCAASCSKKNIRLQSRAERVLIPPTSVHKAVWMAIERGKLQNFIFDQQALASHRAMAAILGAILRLPPVRRAMASRQLKSRYLDRLLSRVH